MALGMKKILIIEDDENKRNDIVEFLKDNYPDKETDLALSFNAGVRKAMNGSYDLMLVDMTLPKFDKDKGSNERTLHNGGELLIGYLMDLGIMIKSIVITQYDYFGEETLETIDTRLKTDCHETYMGAVKYNSSEDGWKYELTKYIDNVIYSYN